MSETVKVENVVKKYRQARTMTQEQFSDALSHSLVNTGLSRVAVTNWESGKSEPGTDFLLMVMMVYSDWRMEFAIDCLCAKLPEVFVRDERGALTTLKSTVLS
jgi:DNA-binding XRE family transcriptional regulator